MPNKQAVLDRLDLRAFYKEAIHSLTGDPQASGKCPLHDDRRASFSVNLDNGLFNCHGCGKKGDVFTFHQELKGVDFKTALKELAGVTGITEGGGKREKARYDYKDENGALLYQVVRYEPKDFRPRRKGPDGSWMYDLQGVRRVPYNLPGLVNASAVVVCEGEKDCDNVKSLGYTGNTAVTTVNGGANAWRDEYKSHFLSKSVAIVHDLDEPGRKFAETVARSLCGTASVIRVVTLPLKDGEGKDASDFIALRRKEGRTDKEIKEELNRLIKETPAWEPKIELAREPETLKEQGGPTPLPDELSTVEPFEATLLPETLRPWAEDISERIQCPPDFVAVGIMTGLAAVLGRKVAIRPQEHTDWTIIANQWGMVVGRPGVLKSPAIEATLAPIKRLAAKATEQYEADFEEYKKNQIVAKLRAEAGEKAARKQLEKDPGSDATDLLAVLAVDNIAIPAVRRYMANDTSSASLGELLRQNQNGLLVYRDELVSLLKGLDREDQAEGRGFYLTGWNGDSSYTFDRIGRGLNLHIEAVCLSVLGGTQPGRLAEYISYAVRGGAGDDGLIQRFGLLVWPDISGTWKEVDRWPDNEAKNTAFKVYEYLDNINPASIGAQQDRDLDGNPNGPPYLRLSAAALELFQEWRTNLEARLRVGELHPALESHFAKYRKLIPGLALIIHLADSGSGPVTEKAMVRALAWGDYLETHAKRAYGAISQPDVSTAKAVLARIKKGNLHAPFSSRDVWRPGWAQLSDREQVSNGLRMLVDYGWLREERLETGATGGRPATVYHLIEGGEK